MQDFLDIDYKKSQDIEKDMEQKTQKVEKIAKKLTEAEEQQLYRIYKILLDKYEATAHLIDDTKDILELTRALTELKKTFNPNTTIQEDTSDEGLPKNMLSKFKAMLKDEF